MSDIPGLRALYAHLAQRYEHAVIPVFSPLAADLSQWIIHCVNDRLHYALYDPFDLDDEALTTIQPLRAMNTLQAADMGTGTGILARFLAPHFGRVVGIDVSSPMLHIAADLAPRESLRFVTADLHHLPLRKGAIHLITSSFGLNASTPKKSLGAFARILRSGEGMLAFQEWGVEDDASTLVDEILHEYSPDEVPGLDEALSQFHTGPKPWYDQLQDTEDYYDLLKQLGFESVWVREEPFTTVYLPSVDDFLNCKLAWPLRYLSLQAMSPATRSEFEITVRERLRVYTNSDGSFEWSPSLFRVFAIR
jgi:ubiquinone/menaquinone biosynthesis C-methylase UbiE